jgi:hypothetical protein
MSGGGEKCIKLLNETKEVVRFGTTGNGASSNQVEAMSSARYE